MYSSSSLVSTTTPALGQGECMVKNALSIWDGLINNKVMFTIDNQVTLRIPIHKVKLARGISLCW